MTIANLILSLAVFVAPVVLLDLVTQIRMR